MDFLLEAFEAFTKYAPAIGIVITIAMMARRLQTKADTQQLYDHLKQQLDDHANRLNKLDGDIAEVKAEQRDIRIDMNRNFGDARAETVVLQRDISALHDKTDRIERDMEATRNLVEAHVLGVPVASPESQ